MADGRRRPRRRDHALRPHRSTACAGIVPPRMGHGARARRLVPRELAHNGAAATHSGGVPFDSCCCSHPPPGRFSRADHRSLRSRGRVHPCAPRSRSHGRRVGVRNGAPRPRDTAGSPPRTGAHHGSVAGNRLCRARRGACGRRRTHLANAPESCPAGSRSHAADAHDGARAGVDRRGAPSGALRALVQPRTRIAGDQRHGRRALPRTERRQFRARRQSAAVCRHAAPVPDGQQRPRGVVHPAARQC